MKKSTVRIFAIVLVVLMCLSLLPLAAAHAMEYPAEMPEIPGFTWMGDHYVETEHIYGEVVNEDFLVDESEPGDCETPALYWRSCINRNPFTEERCGVTAETAYQEALQRAANDLNMQKSSGVQHTDSEWQDIWNRTAEEILNRYTFYYGGFGHQWVEVEYQPATCEQDGWETYHYCSACGEGLDYIPLIPATGHRYEDGICAVCGKADPDYAPVASSDNAPLTLSDSASFNSDEPGEEQGNEPLPNNDEIPVGNADGNVVITYNANGGVGDDYTQTIAADATNDTLTPCGFTREHYTFIGWNTADDGTGDAYIDEASVNKDSFTDTAVTLYAQWEKSEVVITFNANSGNGADYTQIISADANLDANTFTKDYYAFVGWNTAADGSGEGFDETQEVTLETFEGAEVKLYAQWLPFVTFYGNGEDSGEVEGQTIYYDRSTPLNENKFIRENYKFTGWNTTADGSGESFTDKWPVKAGDFAQYPEHKLYAQWARITVTFNANGGSGNMAEQALDTTPTNLYKNSFTRNGYRFIGWDTDALGSGQHFKDEQMVSTKAPTETETHTYIDAPITLYAQWQKRIDIVYQSNGGVSYSKTDTHYAGDTAVVMSLGETGIPVKNQRTFSGEWNTNSKGGEEGVFLPGKTISLTNDTSTPIILYAQWDFEVTFDKNAADATGTMETKKTREYADFPIPTNSFKRDNYRFTGWNTSSDGKGKPYDDGVTIDGEEMANPITLYAQWVENPSIYFDINNETGAEPKKVPANADGTVTLPTPDPTRAEYEFVGWETEDGSKVYTDTIPAKDVLDLNGKTLKAKWDKIYTVNFKNTADSSQTMESQVILQSAFDEAGTTGVELNANEFTNTGKVFTGWKTEDGNKTFEPNGTITKDDFGTGTTLDLFAVWKDYATITFNGNGSTSGEMSKMNVTDEAKPLTENAYKRTGYRFNRWNTEADGSGSPFEDKAMVDTTTITMDVTLYAQWVKEFTVKYQANGGTGPIVKPETYLAGEEVTIANNGFTKTGADFDSWNTKADGSGTTYKPGDKHTFKETDSDLTLYAQWTYTVTFDPNGEGSTGEIKPGNKDKAFEKQAYDIPENMSEGEDPKPLITRTGYAFNGWNTKADGTGDKYADGGTVPASKVTGPFTLYAQWDQEYTVNFNNTADSSQTMEPQIILKSVLDKAGATGVALNPNTFTYDGHVFTGWSKNAAGTDGHFDDEGKVKATDFDSYATLTLYAQWEHEIVITFKPGYDSALTHTQSVAKDKEVKELDANPFTRPQYLFKNWKTDDGRLYEDKDSIPAEYVKEDFNLTAQWNGPLTIKDTVTGSETTAYVGEPIQATIPETDGVAYKWYATVSPTAGAARATQDSWTKNTLTLNSIPEKTVEYPYIYCVAMKGSKDDGTYQETQSNYILLKDKLDTVEWGMDFINDGNLEKYPNAQYHTTPGYIEGVEEGMYYSTNGGVTWTKIPSNRISDGNFLVPGTGTYLIKPSEKSSVKSDPITIYNWYVVGYTVSTSTSASGTVRMTASNSSSSSGAMPSTPVLAESTQTQRDNNTIMKLASNWDNLWAVRSDNSRSITLSVQPSGSNSYGHIALNGTQIGTVSSTRSSSSSSSSSSSTWTTSVSPVSQPKIYSIVFNNSATSPRTADESHLGLWSALCLISLTGAATILGKTFKRKKTR